MIALSELTVGILGLGQIGGSIAAVLRAGRSVKSIEGFDLDGELTRAAKEHGIIDHAATDTDELIERSDIVVLALPIPSILKFVTESKVGFDSVRLIIDTGSTKSAITDAAREVGLSNFVGGHPMAGSEKRGSDAWNADLFRGRPFFLTRIEEVSSEVQQLAFSLAGCVGAKAVAVDSVEHDALIGVSIHAPHVLAYALKKVFRSEAAKNNHAALFAGPSYASATRVTASDPDMVGHMLWHNRENTITALESIRERIAEMEKALRSEDPSDMISALTRDI